MIENRAKEITRISRYLSMIRGQLWRMGFKDAEIDAAIRRYGRVELGVIYRDLKRKVLLLAFEVAMEGVDARMKRRRGR